MTSGRVLRLLVASVAATRTSPLMLMILLCEAVLVLSAAAFAASAIFAREAPSPGPSVEWKAPTFALVASIRPRSNVDLHTLSRPIFSRTRRPANAASPRPPAPVAAIAPSGVSLKGIIKYGRSAKAFLTSSSNPQGDWKTIGDKLDSWTVDQIEQEHLSIKNGTQFLQYSLYPEIEPSIRR
jgi:hypothetical protein